MKTLKNKVFWVIFLMLTLFLLSILFISGYQSYTKQRENIKSTLFRMDTTKSDSEIVSKVNKNEEGVVPEIKENIKEPNHDSSIEVNKTESDHTVNVETNKIEPNINNNEIQSKIFMDSYVYTVKLDENNEITEIINHTPEDVNEDKIKEAAEEIISQQDFEEVKISNLFFDNYSYLFLKNENSLIIMDNTTTTNNLMQSFRTSIIIFVILEIVIIVLSKNLTNWIIEPVIETFNKQKQFIADASHELKTPLSVIIASSEALENDPKETKWLNNIKSESERMSNLVTDLLEMAKSENGIKEQYVIDNLSKLVEREVLTFESLIYEKDIKLEYDIQENITFLCNSNQIKQLVAILIDNAVKHSESKGEIIIKLKNEKKNIILSVTNKGKEIPKAEREKIFERFYRADESRSRNENRYGLGLAIAKNIVTNHNGTIQVNCENGYTTFKVIMKL